ncbi:MAG: hypothetical protein E6G45_14805 [Actinobacteria bacterium]|nr:MAG: hypothetical protein E6G45_14805 [Actinomycetota bacterium]
MLLALSTGHKVGLAVVGAAFILFALGSSFLFPRFRPQFPGHGLRAFIVVTFVFFFGMLAAVEVFGAEPKEHKAAESTAETTTAATSTTAPTTTAATTTTVPNAPPGPPVPTPRLVKVTEKEFKIILASTSLKAGTTTFQIENTGAIAHDLAIVGGPKSALIQPGKTGTLTATLKAGTVELYCSVPGHKAAGMDLKVKVSATASAAKSKPPAPTAKPPAAPQAVDVTEQEFKIILATPTLKAGTVTFKIKNTGAIAHDLAIVGGPKSALIQPGKTGTLTATLKAGTVELYCSVPGHKAAGMDLKVKVS